MKSFHNTKTCDLVATEACSHRQLCDTVANVPGEPECPYERRSLLNELAAKGVRLTAQRRAVIEIIQSADQHLDAASLLEQAQKTQPNLDRATVYRTLDLLKKHRLVDELDLMHLRGERHYYEVKTRREHIHLACFQCGQIEEFSSLLLEKLKAEISRNAGFEVGVTRLELGGRCAACAGITAKQGEGAAHALTNISR